MTLFQIVLFGLTLYFAYEVYRHINALEDTQKEEKRSKTEPKKSLSVVDPEYLEQKGDEAYAMGDFAHAYKLFEEAYAKDADNVAALNKMALMLDKLGRDVEAIERYKESLAKNPDDDTVYNALASTYKKIGRYDEAKECYEKALAIDDKYAVTYFNYANLAVDRGDIERAKELYAKAYALDDSMIQAKFELEKLS